MCAHRDDYVDTLRERQLLRKSISCHMPMADPSERQDPVWPWGKLIKIEFPKYRFMVSMTAKEIARNRISTKYIVLIMCLLVDINAYAAEMPTIAKDHCGGCHAVEKELYAPSLKAIAAKYRGDADAANKLTEVINRGGTFGWNSGMRMPARGLNANDKEIKAMVEFIVDLFVED